MSRKGTETKGAETYAVYSWKQKKVMCGLDYWLMTLHKHI